MAELFYSSNKKSDLGGQERDNPPNNVQWSVSNTLALNMRTFLPLWCFCCCKASRT